MLTEITTGVYAPFFFAMIAFNFVIPFCLPPLQEGAEDDSRRSSSSPS